MSTAVVAFNPNAVARPSFATKGEMSAIVKALVGSGMGGKRISIKNGVFRLMDAGKEIASIEDRYLDLVIINASPKVNRTFYATAFKEGETVAPACWSADGELPDKTLKQPQAPSCAACPKNIKGSGTGDSRACRFSQRLAVVLANDIEGDVLQLTVPATSLFGKAEGEKRPLQEYVRFHAAQQNDISMMVTRARFDVSPDVEGQKLVFKAMRWLDDEEFAITRVKSTSQEAIEAITMTVSQQDAVAPAAPALAGNKPAAKAAPEEEPAPAPKKKAAAAPDDEPPAPAPRKKKAAPAPDDEAPAPEPKVKKTAPAATPLAASSVAAVLGEWDDE